MRLPRTTPHKKNRHPRAPVFSCRCVITQPHHSPSIQSSSFGNEALTDDDSSPVFA